MKVAAYQAPLLPSGSLESIALIREQVERCESAGVEILCCPEGVLGGLADYSPWPGGIAIDVRAGGLDDILAPLASERVTTIIGFTEVGPHGRLYNSAAVFHRGSVLGVYRKLHPAINRSVYDAGEEMPVFTVRGLTFGILICRDSLFVESARVMRSRGATALFVPTNNGLPPGKGGPELVGEARAADVVLARDNGIFVVRADVAGRADDLTSYGSSGIVDPAGVVLLTAQPLTSDLLVADIDVGSPRSQIDAARSRSGLSHHV